ncbi:hypothetical protein ABID65_007636 [Bradyrhizobium sp. S3.9.2]|uniref:hypothetical protein n=1 Tax=Bradyrhizobium TaxID=374 RepID=UPI00117E524B|nr:hypothetical protein [Bradyrhizobium japonicum]
MSNRHDRRRYRREASGALLTYLVDIDDPLDAHPLLQRAARRWCDGLSAPPHRECVTCGVQMSGKRCVGALLLTTPASTKPTVASVFGVCRECWLIRDLSLEVIERKATEVLQAVVPNGRFEPHSDART